MSSTYGDMIITRLDIMIIVLVAIFLLLLFGIIFTVIVYFGGF